MRALEASEALPRGHLPHLHLAVLGCDWFGAISDRVVIGQNDTILSSWVVIG